MRQFSVTRAEPEDAEPILRVRFAAIHETAAAFYPEEILQNWSGPITEERIQRMKRAISGEEELFVVARHGAELVGFGCIVPKYNALRGLYVHPSVGRRGVGAQILEALEKRAICAGMASLEIEASINAEAFYARHGFAVVARGTHRLRSGQEMACVRMRKTLGSASGS